MKSGCYDHFSEVFKALGHPVRLKIVCGLIKKSQCNVNTMAEKLNVSQPSVSQHLNILKNARIIEGYRNGNQICYKVVNNDVLNMINVICDVPE